MVYFGFFWHCASFLLASIIWLPSYWTIIGVKHAIVQFHTGSGSVTFNTRIVGKNWIKSYFKLNDMTL